jgi:hypothetical protein
LNIFKNITEPERGRTRGTIMDGARLQVGFSFDFFLVSDTYVKKWPESCTAIPRTSFEATRRRNHATGAACIRARFLGMPSQVSVSRRFKA